MADRYNIQSLVPFGYTASTRLKSRRDYLYLISSQWGIGLVVLSFLGPSDYHLTLINYALGYIAFISIYEIGYLWNDIWDAKRSSDGRMRFEGEVTARFIGLFLAIRLIVWLVLTFLFLQGEIIFWFLACLVLIVVFSAHNILSSSELRYASFFQLALLRFSLPLIFSLPSHVFDQILIVAVLHYAYFRSLAYLDSKQLLMMPHRRDAGFSISQTLLMFPIILCLYISTGSILYPVAWAYTAASHAIFFFSFWHFRSRR
jgi:hypothetical protein